MKCKICGEKTDSLNWYKYGSIFSETLPICDNCLKTMLYIKKEILQTDIDKINRAIKNINVIE